MDRAADGRSLPARRQPGEELGDVGRLASVAVAVLGREVLAVLQQVGAVRVQGVAGEAALELQVGEEVEEQGLEPGIGAGPCRRGGSRSTRGHAGWFGPPAGPCRK